MYRMQGLTLDVCTFPREANIEQLRYNINSNNREYL